MKNLHLIVFSCLMLSLMMGGCRHYEAKYAYVATDTLHQQGNDADSIDSIVEETDADNDEGIITVPDIPQESSMKDIMNPKNREATQQVDKMYSGEELE